MAETIFDAVAGSTNDDLKALSGTIGDVPSGQTIEGQISTLNSHDIKFTRLWNTSGSITLPTTYLCSYLFIASQQSISGQISSNTQATVAILNFNTNGEMNIVTVAGKTPNITKNGSTITIAKDYGYGWCGVIPYFYW